MKGETLLDTTRTHSTRVEKISPRQTITIQSTSERAKGKTKHAEDEILDIDWRKVGKIHEPNAAVDAVIAKEVERLQKAFDIKLTEQFEDALTKKVTETT